LATASPYIHLKNGESFVYSVDPTTALMTLKEPLEEAPAPGDKVKLIPTTARNIYDHFNKKQISGLTIAANVNLVDAGKRIQISSKTPGGAGQVFAVGGRGAGLSFLRVRGTAQEINQNRALIELDRSAADVLAPGHTVQLVQLGKSKKKFPDTQPTSATQFTIETGISTSEGADTRLTFGVSLVKNYSFTHTGTVTWAVRKLGRKRARYEIISGNASIPSGLKMDDWVFVGNGNSYANQTPAQVFSTSNQGWFQVRETDNSTYFDVQNTAAFDEFIETNLSPFIFTSYHSARPGDTLVIGADTPVVTANQGMYKILAVTAANIIEYKNANAVGYNSVAIGSENSTISVLDQGYETYRKVVIVNPKPGDPTNRAQVVVSPGYDLSVLNESQGAVMALPNRLGFGTDPTPGMSGYQFWTGLKRKVQKVVDGYEPDSSTFPGVRAAGVQIEVREPQIQRVSISLKIKTSKGVSLQSLSDSIKSTVAGYINSLGLGQDVILSECIKLAQDVPGVEAVVMSYPSPTTERITINTNAIARISVNDVSLS
jgi:hypothetical protein